MKRSRHTGAADECPRKFVDGSCKQALALLMLERPLEPQALAVYGRISVQFVSLFLPIMKFRTRTHIHSSMFEELSGSPPVFGLLVAAPPRMNWRKRGSHGLHFEASTVMFGTPGDPGSTRNIEIQRLPYASNASKREATTSSEAALNGPPSDSPAGQPCVG